MTCALFPSMGALTFRITLPNGMAMLEGTGLGKHLVVETTNFSAKSSFRRSGSNLHLEERYTRIADDRLQYEFTVTDDTTWEQPWTVSFPMVKGGEPLYEFACHEGNYGLENILRAARHLEKQQQ